MFLKGDVTVLRREFLSSAWSPTCEGKKQHVPLATRGVHDGLFACDVVNEFGVVCPYACGTFKGIRMHKRKNIR